MRTRSSVVVCVTLLAGGLSASPTCVLKGRVRDARTGEPLVGASVVVRGTECGNATDLNGDYVIVGLPEMTGTATAAYAGYNDTSASFTTTAACTTHLDFGLRVPLVQLTTVWHPPGSARPLPPRPRPIALPLPARSDSRLYKSWGCIWQNESMLAIEQVGDSVLVQAIGPRIAPMPLPSPDGPSIKEGIVPIAEFRAFWDSLGRLGFWQLKDRYDALKSYSGEGGGSISVTFQSLRGGKTSKTIGYSCVQSCSLEFRRVYSLFDSMVRFARTVPDWKTLLRYDTVAPIEGLEDWYHYEALQAIGAIRDSQDLDTLQSMLMHDDQYAGAIIVALGNIGSKRAVPALEEFTARLEAESAPARRYDLIGDAAKALFAVNGLQSAATIRRVLRPPCPPRLVYALSKMLAGAGDYSGVPAVVEILSGPARGEVTWAVEALKEIGYGSQMAISALLDAAQKEMKADQPSDRVMIHTCLALTKLTGQPFTYHPEDSLSVKRSNMAEWLKWWKANAKRYPVGPGDASGR
ncbi:carboxypeptidase-like regulatory domain-containing protein [candidate division WOR-3 bacterium]|nr:carboxypeptidase-like regulatory domain-containing protein [candidate division WOR-3 bacterium]